jgi:hypothetical protein
MGLCAGHVIIKGVELKWRGLTGPFNHRSNVEGCAGFAGMLQSALQWTGFWSSHSLWLALSSPSAASRRPATTAVAAGHGHLQTLWFLQSECHIRCMHRSKRMSARLSRSPQSSPCATRPPTQSLKLGVRCVAHLTANGVDGVES